MSRAMISKIALWIVVAGVFLQSCGDDGIIEIPSAADNLQRDLAEIDEYIAKNGYTSVDTTASRVRYIIIEEGTGETIELNDIVTLHYTGRLLDEVFLISSIDSVVSNANMNSEDSTIVYTTSSPLVFTHTVTNWGMSLATNLIGLTEGGSAALNKLKIGGSAKIIIPSTLANGSISGGQLNASSPVIFDIYPVRVRK